MKRQISNLVCTTRFWNNLHQVRSKPNKKEQRKVWRSPKKFDPVTLTLKINRVPDSLKD